MHSDAVFMSGSVHHLVVVSKSDKDNPKKILNEIRLILKIGLFLTRKLTDFKNKNKPFFKK